MTFLKAVAKFIRLLFMLIGLFTLLALSFMLITESGRVVIESQPMGKIKSYLLIGGVMAIALFLFIYNIICLKKEIDVFFWLIFRHKEYREKYPKKLKKRQKKEKKENIFERVDAPTIQDEPKEENIRKIFASNDIIMLIQKIDPIQIGYSDNKLYISDVQVSQKDKDNYLVNVDTIVKLIDPPKDKEQLEDFKRQTNISLNKMADLCNKRLSPFASEYGFYYEIKVNTRIEK